MAKWYSGLAGFGARFKAWALGPAVVSDANGFGNGLQGLTRRRIDGATFLELSTAVYAAVDIRSATLSSVPVKVYRVSDDGTREAVTGGPLVELLEQVNPFWTLRRLLEAVEVSLCIRGEAFIVVDRGPNGKGAPREMWYARADRMKVIPHATDYIAGFLYEDPSGKKIPLSTGEVIWLRGIIDPRNEFRSLSPLESARLSVETSLKAMESNMAIFTNGMSPGGILSPVDGSSPLTREQREMLEAQIGARLAGADKAHRVAVFSHAMKLETPQLTPADAEFMKLLGWTLGDVARVFKVPPTKLQDFSRATYSNAEQADKALYTDCIIPEARRIASDLTEQLIPMFGDRSLVIEFDFSQVRAIQEDQTEITAQMQVLAAIGVPLNRLLEVYRPDLLPHEGGGYAWGDVPAGPAVPLAGSMPVAPAGPEPGELEEAIRSALKAAGYITGPAPRYGSIAHRVELASRDRRIVGYERRLYDAMRQVQGELLEDLKSRARAPRTRGTDKAVGAGESLDPEGPFPRREWRARFVEAGEPIIAEAMGAGGQRGIRELPVSGVAFDVTSPAALAALARARNRLAGVTDTAWEDIRAVLVRLETRGRSLDEMIAAISGLGGAGGPLGPARAETIARTESTAAYTAGRLEAWRQSGVVRGKRWLAAQDDRTRHTHKEAHGQEVELDKPFRLLEPATASKPEREVLTDGPGQSGVAQEDINCRCELQPILGRAPKPKPVPVPVAPPAPPPVPVLPPAPGFYKQLIYPVPPADLVGIDAPTPDARGVNNDKRTDALAALPARAPSAYPQSWVDPANPVSGETGDAAAARIYREATRAPGSPEAVELDKKADAYRAQILAINQEAKDLQARADAAQAEWGRYMDLQRVRPLDLEERARKLEAAANASMLRDQANSRKAEAAKITKLIPKLGYRMPNGGWLDNKAILERIAGASSHKYKPKVSATLKREIGAAAVKENIDAMNFALSLIDDRYLRDDQKDRLAYTLTKLPITKAKDGRAFHSMGKEIALGSHSEPEVAAHEMGHAIEAILDGIFALRTQEFVDRRAAGEKFELASWCAPNSPKKEYWRSDRFSNPYAGKLYYDSPIYGNTWNSPLRNDGTAQASEVISMGIQALYENAGELLYEDIDYFAFLWDYFRNRGNAR